MSATGRQEQFRLGFLASIDVSGGYVGGLLVTNHQGRPLEFQCTAPVKPNRTQEILYGPTLRPFVLGELIGRTLLEKIAVKPHLVLTEDPALLDLRPRVGVAVACLDEAEAGDVRIGRQTIRFHSAHASDRTMVEQQAGLLPRDADLREPFERVREALQETLAAGAVR